MNTKRIGMFVVLVLGFLYLVSMQAARAALMADLEGPANQQPVSGIGIIRGWAFSDSAGVWISQAALRIDGKDITAIPCCSVRADVQDAFPQFPAENTRNSGFGITFNYGNLTSGAHTIAVAIQDSSGAQFERTHMVTVVKAGDFSYIDQLDLNGASAERQGQDVVISGLRARDKDSQQEQYVNARLHWFQNMQSLGLVETSTTAATQVMTPANKLKMPLVQATSAAASIQYAALESPNHGDTGSGIAVVRGWAVAPSDRSIQRVQLFVDGEPSMTIPCCSYRSDVASALPGEPNAANSGFGVTFNYGNLSAGVHSMTVEIEDSSGALRKFVRGILVRNPGDFSFLEQLDLGAAQVRIAGGQLVIEGALARDKATGKTAQRNLRFHWNTPAQAFTLTEESVQDATVADLTCKVDGDTSSLENLKRNPGPSGISLVELITAINRRTTSLGRVFVGFDREGSITCSDAIPEINTAISINGDTDGDGSPDIDIQGEKREHALSINSSDVTIQQLYFRGADIDYEAINVDKHISDISNIAILNNKMTGVYRGFSVDPYNRLALSHLLISNNLIINNEDHEYNVINIESSLDDQDHYENLIIANNNIENADINIDSSNNDSIIHSVNIIDNNIIGGIEIGTPASDIHSSTGTVFEGVIIGNSINKPNNDSICITLDGTQLTDVINNTISCSFDLGHWYQQTNRIIQAAIRGNRFINGKILTWPGGENNTMMLDITNNQLISRSTSYGGKSLITLAGGEGVGTKNNKAIVKINNNELSDELPMGKYFFGIYINGGSAGASNSIITGEITNNKINAANNNGSDSKKGLTIYGGLGYNSKTYAATQNIADVLTANNDFNNLKNGVYIAGGYSQNNNSIGNKVLGELLNNSVENSSNIGIKIYGGEREINAEVVNNEVQANISNNITDGLICKDNIPGNIANCILSGNTDTKSDTRSIQIGQTIGMNRSVQKQMLTHMEQLGNKEQQLRERAATISDPRLQKRLLDLSDRLHETQYKMSARMTGVPMSALSDQMER